LSDSTPVLPDAQHPSWSIADVALFFGLAVPFFLTGSLAVIGLMTAAGVHGRGLRVLLPQFAGYAAGLAPLWIVFRNRHGESPLRLLRMGATLRDASHALPAGIVLSFAVLALAALMQVPQKETPMEQLLSDRLSLAVAAVLGVTLGPWFEELMFRGLLQPVAVRALGAIPGIVIAALPFALLHGPQYGWSWKHILLITVAGAAFGWKRHTSGSTGAAALMHSAYNLVLFAGYIAGKWLGTDLPRTI
jgi:membrane protease YdiL (CAAX protease family)